MKVKRKEKNCELIHTVKLVGQRNCRAPPQMIHQETYKTLHICLFTAYIHHLNGSDDCFVIATVYPNGFRYNFGEILS